MDDKLTRIEQKLDDIIDRLTRLEAASGELQSQTSEIHQFVPFVGWLDSSRRSLSSVFSLTDRASSLFGTVEDGPAPTTSVEES